VGALVAFWSAIPWDGVTLGIACNRPEILPVAKAAASSMNLPSVAAFIDRVIAAVPPEVVALGDASDRHAWYTDGPGAKLAAQLDAVETEIQDDDAVDALLLGCMNRMLKEPAHFFHN
jgi:hypothetical protein